MGEHVQEAVAALQEVYGDDIEACDLLVGNLAEKKIPGFAISETSFHVFILMASRRLEADRFLTEHYTPAVRALAVLRLLFCAHRHTAYVDRTDASHHVSVCQSMRKAPPCRTARAWIKLVRNFASWLQVYTQEGLDWVTDTRGLRDVIARHYPDIAADMPPGASAFTPYVPMPPAQKQ